MHRDLNYWRSRRASMRITEADPSPSTVMFGSRVTIERNGKSVEVCPGGEDEADPASDLVAWTAPLVRALVGSTVGEMVALETASGRETIEVLRISAL